MKKTRNFSWKKGTGAEIMAILIIALGCITITCVCIIYGRLNANVQAQVLADIIADGSCAYAKNEMDISKIALEAMVEKLYQANQSYNNGVTLTGKPGITGPNAVADIISGSSLFSDSERHFFINSGRTTIMSGNMKHARFQVGMDPRIRAANQMVENAAKLESNKDNQALSTESVYDVDPNVPAINVPYNGPRYLDEYVTITVSASCKIPLAGMTTVSKSSTVVSIAEVPYNSRVPVDARYQGIFNQIEAKAYEECTLSDAEKLLDNPNRIRYGSMKQKVFLEARRPLGDGYARENIDTLQWPVSLPRTRILSASSGTLDKDVTSFPEPNKLKDCEAFIESLFHFDDNGGLSAIEGSYSHESKSRHLEYKPMSPSAEELWDAMHPETIEGSYPASYKKYHGTSWISNGAISSIPASYHSNGTEKYPAGMWHGIGDGLDPEDGWFVKSCTLVGYNYYYVLQKGPQLTYGEALSMYSTENGGHLWELAKTPDPVTFITGDIIFWENPNAARFVAPILAQIACAGSKEEVAGLGDPENAKGKICHVGMCFDGDSELIIEMGEGGVGINPLQHTQVMPPAGHTDMAIGSYVRFTD